MKTLLLASGVLLSSTFASLAHAAAPEKSLCHADETVLFQCTVKGKQASLCASGATKTDAGKLQYRYGADKKIELSYPDTPQPAQGKFFRSATGYSGGGEDRIRFRNGDYDYFLFERTVRTGFGNGPNNPEFSGGIITRRGKTVTTRLCTQDDPIKDGARALPEEDFEYLDD